MSAPGNTDSMRRCRAPETRLYFASPTALFLIAAVFCSEAAHAQDRPTPILRTIHDAAEAGNLDRVEELLQLGVNINEHRQFRGGHTPLLLAIMNKRNEVVDFLIEQGADPNLGVYGRFTPLHAAAKLGDVALCGRLIALGADVNVATTDRRRTPLHEAARMGRDEVIQLLSEHGATLDATEVGGDTPLHFALRFNRRAAATRLVELGANVTIHNADDVSSFEEAVEQGSRAMARVLLEAVPTARANYRRTLLDRGLYLAVLSRSAELVRFLLEQGARADMDTASGLSLLHLAAESGAIDVVDALLDAGLDVNARTEPAGWTPLYSACMNGHEDAVRVLCERGADTNATDGFGRTPLHIATLEHGNLRIVRTLVDHGADTQVRDVHGRLPLQFAADAGKTFVARYLSGKRGVSANVPAGSQAARDELSQRAITELLAGLERPDRDALEKRANAWLAQGRPLIHLAAREGSVTAIRLFVERDPDLLNHRDRYRYTPLHAAADAGRGPVVAFLLERGSAPGDQANVARWTPLHFAASGGRVAVARVLVNAGADPNARDGAGRTPLDVARALSRHAMVQFLERQRG